MNSVSRYVDDMFMSNISTKRDLIINMTYHRTKFSDNSSFIYHHNDIARFLGYSVRYETGMPEGLIALIHRVLQEHRHYIIEDDHPNPRGKKQLTIYWVSSIGLYHIILASHRTEAKMYRLQICEANAMVFDYVDILKHRRDHREMMKEKPVSLPSMRKLDRQIEELMAWYNQLKSASYLNQLD